MPNPRLMEGYTPGVDDDPSSFASFEEQLRQEQQQVAAPPPRVRQPPPTRTTTTVASGSLRAPQPGHEEESASFHRPPAFPEIREPIGATPLSYSSLGAAAKNNGSSSRPAAAMPGERGEQHAARSSASLRSTHSSSAAVVHERSIVTAARSRYSNDGNAPRVPLGSSRHDQASRQSHQTRQDPASHNGRRTGNDDEDLRPIKKWIYVALTFICVMIVVISIVVVFAALMDGNDENRSQNAPSNQFPTLAPTMLGTFAPSMAETISLGRPTASEPTTADPTAQPSTAAPTAQPSTATPTVTRTEPPTVTQTPTAPPRCFTSLDELSFAVDRYVIDPSGGLTAAEYGHPIGEWCITGVSDLSRLFYPTRNADLTLFNFDISKWDTSSVRSMRLTFSGLTNFDQDLSLWDTSRVVDFAGTFFESSKFNGNLSSWDVGNVVEATSMFESATSFSQDLCVWGERLNRDAVVRDMFLNSNCPEAEDPELTLTPPDPLCFSCKPPVPTNDTIAEVQSLFGS